MYDNITTYKIWAPDNARWTHWAKPVLFAKSPNDFQRDIETRHPGWIAGAAYDTAIIVDLPGKESVEEGLSLARLGYRPVPLYNGVMSLTQNSMIVDVAPVVLALFRGAEQLLGCTIAPDAPPVFLLDSNRMPTGHAKRPGFFDNRWCVFPQDMPSVDYLLSMGIRRVVVRSGRIQDDLSHILCRYQEKGIQICQCINQIQPVTVAKPSKFRGALYRFGVTAGLTRNAAGGFGSTVPEPTQGGSGARTYGYG